MLLTLTGCTELARFIGKTDPKPEEPAIAEQTTPQQTEERVEGPVEKPKPSKLYEWNGDGRKVSRIVIDTDKQRASFFVGEDEIGWSTVASGLPRHPTPTGRFAVMEKVENKRSNLYGKVVKNGKVVRSNAKAGRDPIPAGARFEGAHMPYFMRLTYDGIGLHAGPIPRPGQPASHGCIRLPSTLAPVLFKHVSHGTEVTIVGSGPSYGNYVEKQRIAAERARREAEQRRIAGANAAAAAATSAETSPAVASTASAMPRPEADSRPAQQAATTPPAEPPTASSAGVPAADPATASPASAPASTQESSTASAAPRDPSPASGSTAADVTPATWVTTAPAAAMGSPENAPQAVAEPAAAAAPEQAGAEPDRAAPPETKTTATPETARPADSASPPARSSAPEPATTQTPVAPASSDPAPAAEASQSPSSTGNEASQTPASAAPPAAPAAPPAQAQQAPAASAEGNDG
jgi:lipoprotein-anchoring transpeptidase ErfK/SrfK